jgi:hypothetical protein
MRAFKSLDLFIQLLLLVLLGAAYLIGNSEKLSIGLLTESPIILILAFGGMQIISILVHLAAGPQAWKKSSWRKFHLIGTALVLVAIAVAFIQDSTGRTGDRDDKYSMPGLETLVYATIPAILLALFYTVITWFEWMKMKKQIKGS